MIKHDIILCDMTDEALDMVVSNLIYDEALFMVVFDLIYDKI